MESIEAMLSDIQRAAVAAEAAGHCAASGTVLADPARLLGLLAAGERRRLASESRLGVPVPRYCMFSVTWRCNLNCAGCYAKNYGGPGTLTPAEIDRVIREATGMGTFVFIIVGGEPLMVPGLIELLGQIDGALFFLFTNGTLLDAEMARRLRGSPNILPVISVEGNRTLTDARRGGGVGVKVAGAMAELRAVNVPFAFSSMITHQSLSCLTSRAWFDQLWRAGARFGFLIDYIPFPHSLDESLVLTDADRAAKRALILQRQREARPLVVNFPPDEYADGGGCQGAGRGFVHINADGFVEPCPFSHWAVDNVRDKALADILASPFFTGLRDELADLPNPRGGCLLFENRAQVAEIAQRTGGFFTERCPAAAVALVV